MNDYNIHLEVKFVIFTSSNYGWSIRLIRFDLYLKLLRQHLKGQKLISFSIIDNASLAYAVILTLRSKIWFVI